MHPGIFAWLKQARRHGDCGASAVCGPQGEGGGGGWGRHGHHGPGHHGPGHHSPGHEGWGGEQAHAGGEHDGDFGGGSFGVRRPLRFLAYKLELDEKQVAELARVLNELKTERAQAEVDNRRTVTAFADAVESGAFNEPRSREGGDLRVKSAERLRDAVTLALSRIHAMLEDDQRKRLSYLIRTGVVSL